jgi:hypothetical protein
MLVLECKDGYYWDELLKKCSIIANCVNGFYKIGEICVKGIEILIKILFLNDSLITECP